MARIPEGAKGSSAPSNETATPLKTRRRLGGQYANSGMHFCIIR